MTCPAMTKGGPQRSAATLRHGQERPGGTDEAMSRVDVEWEVEEMWTGPWRREEEGGEGFGCNLELGEGKTRQGPSRGRERARQ